MTGRRKEEEHRNREQGQGERGLDPTPFALYQPARDTRYRIGSLASFRRLVASWPRNRPVCFLAFFGRVMIPLVTPHRSTPTPGTFCQKHAWPANRRETASTVEQLRDECIHFPYWATPPRHGSLISCHIAQISWPCSSSADDSSRTYIAQSTSHLPPTSVTSTSTWDAHLLCVEKTWTLA